MEDVRVVLTTFETEEQAAEIASRLVEERVVACANLLPGVRSFFRWQGKVEVAGEVLCLLKTRVERIEDLKVRLAELHPYDVPELLVLPVAGGSADYLSWVRAEST